MPRKDKGEEKSPARSAGENGFDVARLRSLSEARAYQKWKEEVPVPVRQAVESSMKGDVKAPTPTGLPRVDAFLGALADQLADPSKSQSKLSEPLVGLFQHLRSIETDVGAGDGVALLAGKDVSFVTKFSIWRDHVAPVVRWLREQDLAPKEEPEEREPQSPQEGEKVPAPEEPTPPPDTDSFTPSMDEMGGKQEGEPQAHFTVTPFYGGYYRRQVYGRWNEKTLAWERVPTKEEDLESEKIEELSIRVLSGSVRAGEKMTLPVPYGWTVEKDSIETNASAEPVHLAEDENDSVTLKIDGKGIFSYRLRIGRRVASKPIEGRHEGVPAQDRLPKEIKELVAETKKANLSAGGKARFLIKGVREHLKYSNDSSMNAVYQSDPAKYFERIWQEKKVDCDVANTVAAAVLRSAGIPCRLITGHYVKSKMPDNRALMTGGTGHAWLEVWDADAGQWFRADATPKGDPTLDDERPDEQEKTESGEGDYGEQEAEIMSDEDLEKLIESLEGASGQDEKKKSSEERLIEEFAEQAECSMEEAREVLQAFRRVREMKDGQGERIGQKLINEWRKLVQGRMAHRRHYEGPVRMTEGDELAEPALAKIDIRSGEQNPSGFEKVTTVEKRQKLFGGLDVYLLLDLSGSMAEVDPQTQRVKADLQRDFAMLYADSLMQCAFLSRQAEGRLSAPLPIRVQVSSIHGGVSTDLPLVDRWGAKEQVAMYRAVIRTAGGGTPDHLGLKSIEQAITRERAAWQEKTHKASERPPIEFVAVSLDGGSDDPHQTRNALGRLRDQGAVVYGYGMTAAARPIEAIYAPDARVVETLSKHAEIVAKDTLAVFRRLYPERVKR